MDAEVWISPVGERWCVRRAGTAEYLGEFAGRAEAIQEARKIAQRQPGTVVKLEQANGTFEHIPLLGANPLAERA